MAMLKNQQKKSKKQAKKWFQTDWINDVFLFQKTAKKSVF